MARYGYSLHLGWGLTSAPRLCAGIATSLRYDLHDQEQIDKGEDGTKRALIVHSTTADISFAAKVTSASTDFLDLSSTAAAITVTGAPIEAGGVILVSEAVERWMQGVPKTVSISSTHFLDLDLNGGPAVVNTLSAFTPDQSTLAIVTPGDSLIYDTFGMGHASGVLHSLTLTQRLELKPDKPSPDGRILGVQVVGFERRFEAAILAKAAAPALRSTLALTGDAPTHAGGFQILRVATAFDEEVGAMYTLGGLWIPGMGQAEEEEG